MHKASSFAGKFGESPSSHNPAEVFDVRVPKYLRHKDKYARVILNGREIHLGLYGSPESKANYERVISEWLQTGRKAPRPKRLETVKKHRDESGDDAPLTLTELAVRYFKHAQAYYVKNGEPTSEVIGIQIALRDLRKFYSDIEINSFGPTALKTLREDFIQRDLARTTINKQIGRILRMFRWGVSETLVKPETLTALQSVPGLKVGRSKARETDRIRPVAQSDVEAVRVFMNPVVMAMVDIQRLTGMRPGEVCQLRTVDLDRSESDWAYRPPTHKTEHHEKDRVVYFGPLAQVVLEPWLNSGEPEAFVFSPATAEMIRRNKMRALRKSKVQPSQISRAKDDPQFQPGDMYTTTSYRRAIGKACIKAGIEPWHPNQLRHLAATNIRRDFGIEIARAVLGHSTVDMTEVYAEMDFTKAKDAMAKSG